MAAAGDGDEDGVGDVVVHGFADGDGDEFVFGAPDDEGGLGDGGEAGVEQVGPDSMESMDCWMILPLWAMLRRVARTTKGGSGRGCGLSSAWRRASEAASVGTKAVRGKEGWKVRPALSSRTRRSTRAGWSRAMRGGDPAAHGPAVEVGVGEVEGVHEVDDDVFFERDGVGDVGLGGAAVAEEVGHVDVEAGGGEGGNHGRPVFGARAEAVDEDERVLRVSRRAGGLRSSGGGSRRRRCIRCGRSRARGGSGCAGR